MQLTWRDAPADLDLHLVIRSEGQESHLFYSSKGTLDEEPWALLDQDVRRAPGVETITIGRWTHGIYECAVHRFSPVGSLAGCGARVVLDLDGIAWEFRCPESGSGEWWHVFRLNTENWQAVALDSIGNQPL